MLLLADGFDWLFVGAGLFYLIVIILIAIATVVCGIAQIMIFFGYFKGNRRAATCGLTGEQAARKLLDDNGMHDVQVRKCGFFRMLVFGNHYSLSKRTVFLRRSIFNKCSLTAVGIAAQKVGLAEQHRDGSKKFVTRCRLQAFGVFAPILFVPIVLVGVVLDLLIFEMSGAPMIVAAVIGFLFIIAGLITTLLNIPVEKKGIVRAQQMLSGSGMFTEDELHVMSKVYRAYMIQYVTQFIIAFLRLIEFILKVVIQIAAQKKIVRYTSISKK